MKEPSILNLIEKDILERERISFHIPHSKKLNEDHKYLEQQIFWMLIKYIDTKDYDYKAIEEDRRNGIFYSEIQVILVDELNGISNNKIHELMNSNLVFSFEYTPKELDQLIFWTDYKYESVKAIQRYYNRTRENISFTYQNGYWEIDREVKKREVKKSLMGIVHIQ